MNAPVHPRYSPAVEQHTNNDVPEPGPPLGIFDRLNNYLLLFYAGACLLMYYSIASLLHIGGLVLLSLSLPGVLGILFPLYILSSRFSLRFADEYRLGAPGLETTFPASQSQVSGDHGERCPPDIDIGDDGAPGFPIVYTQVQFPHHFDGMPAEEHVSEMGLVTEQGQPFDERHAEISKEPLGSDMDAFGAIKGDLLEGEDVGIEASQHLDAALGNSPSIPSDPAVHVVSGYGQAPASGIVSR